MHGQQLRKMNDVLNSKHFENTIWWMGGCIHRQIRGQRAARVIVMSPAMKRFFISSVLHTSGYYILDWIKHFVRSRGQQPV